jgi:hypothetical protein
MAKVQKHIMKVQNLRSNINKHLDKLEEELKSELHKLENKAKTDIQGTIAILNDKENDIAKRQKNIEDITNMCDAIVLLFLIVIGTKQLNIGQKGRLFLIRLKLFDRLIFCADLLALRLTSPLALSNDFSFS